MNRPVARFGERLLALGRAFISRWDWVMTVASLAFLLCLVMPAPPVSRGAVQPVAQWVVWVENQGRFVNTVAQIALPLMTRDILGLKALIWVTLTGTSATHGLKRTLNDVDMSGVRLGQRPSSEDSRHNFPSGHSALASSGAVFVAARYSRYWLLLLLPMTLATMYARVALDAHTWSAVIAGAALGVLFTWPLCRRRPSRSA
ncbi:MAG: phosphatase PAP2 family protein [Betaproteobacteria bacterium]|nr:phosphatase PAP2 family protein [Betaproteobacteria bacterium]